MNKLVEYEEQKNLKNTFERSNEQIHKTQGQLFQGPLFLEQIFKMKKTNS